MQEESARAEFLANGLLSSLQTLMLTGEGIFAYDWLSRVSKDPGIVKLQVIRSDGRAAFHDLATVDKVNQFLDAKVFQREKLTAEKITDLDEGLLLEAIGGKQIQLFNQEQATLTFLMPIRRGQECMVCHGYDNHQVGGVLRITTSIMHAQERIAANQQWSLLFGLFVMVIIGLLLMIYIRKQVIEPIEKLNDATSHILNGNFDYRVTIKHDDEIGRLGQSFNHMVENLHNTTVSKNYVKNIMNSMGEMLLVLDDEKKIVSLNPSVSRMLGYQETELIGQSIDLILEEKNPLSFSTLDGHQLNSIECSFKMKNDSLLPVLVTISKLSATRTNEQGIVLTARDITIQKRSEQKLLLAAKVMENDSNAIVICDADSKIVLVNPAFSAITGYSKEEVIGNNPSILSSGRQSQEFYESMWHDIHQNGCWAGEIWNKRKNGEIFPEALSITTTHNEQGEITNYVSLFTDITTQKDNELKLAHMAHHDVLTGLPNRTLLIDRLEQAIIHNKRAKLMLAVLFIDIDGFKAVNDTHGHDVGDELLKRIAQGILAEVRKSDTVARIGGDEFTIILENLNFIGNATATANKIINLFKTPFNIDGIDCNVGVSIGISTHPDDADQVDALIKKADTAMYYAKTTGKMKYSIFNIDCMRKE